MHSPTISIKYTYISIFFHTAQNLFSDKLFHMCDCSLSRTSDKSSFQGL